MLPRRFRSAFCLAVIYSLLGQPAPASPPGLPLPTWIDVSVSLPHTPEVGREFPVRAAIAVHLGQARAAAYRFRLPPGTEVVRGEPEGRLDLSAGESRVLTVVARLRKAIGDASVGLDVIATYPADALHKEINTRYKDSPGELVDALRRHLDNLKGEHTFSALATFRLTEEEGFGEQEQVAFSLYLSPPGNPDARFAMLQPRSEPPATAPGSVSDLLARNPKLAELLRRAGKDPQRLAANDRMEQYSAAVRDLQAGKADRALAVFEKLEKSSQDDPLLRTASSNARAAALFSLGRRDEAERLWELLAADDSAGAYAEFNLGESLRAAGRADDAARHYEKALVGRPAFTLARRRLGR